METAILLLERTIMLYCNNSSTSIQNDTEISSILLISTTFAFSTSVPSQSSHALQERGILLCLAFPSSSYKGSLLPNGY